MKINKYLKTICKQATKASNCHNYICDMKIYSGKWEKGNMYPNYNENEHINNILKSIIGDDIDICNVTSSSLIKVIEEMKKGLSYSCINHGHDNIQYVVSKELNYKINEVTNLIKELFKKNSKIYRFTIEEGHPFYPVFWDFSFLIKCEEEAYAFIGSSSD